MIVESSDQVPRTTWVKRFPVPRNSNVTPESRIERGKAWPALLRMAVGAVGSADCKVVRIVTDAHQ